ncbi:Sec39 domain-containing protein [Exophiala viscosa]|uniref:Sec39 domain-containing protein n=1 Tax=Exophiala viscosa TaxID=2486360 RepID=A0AAN6E656_9EURO|nr:Sec39 domain-containing protein [Exophiala viscosa]
MAPLSTSTDAHVVLFAAQLTSEGDSEELGKLVRSRRNVLPDDLLYRLLLSFYPVDTPEQAALVKFLDGLSENPEGSEDLRDFKLDPSISNLSRNDALQRCRTLRLQRLPQHIGRKTSSRLANFIIEWTKRLESLAGTVQPLAEFVEHFVAQDPELQHWYQTYLVPVLRLQCDFYPDAQDLIGVQELETLSVERGIKTILRYSERTHNAKDIARDLDNVVAPWVHGATGAKRRKVDSAQDALEGERPWEIVNDWLITESVRNYELAAKAFDEWNGPVQVQESSDEGELVARYAQTGLALVYNCPQSTRESIAVSQRVISKACNLTGLEATKLSSSYPDIDLPNDFEVEEADLFPGSLSHSTNRFTQVNDSSVQFLVGLLGTSAILLSIGLPSSISELARVCAFGSERRHKEELRRLLQQIPRLTRKEIDWRSVRRQLLWLRSWSDSPDASSTNRRVAYLGQLSADYAETQIVDAFLAAGQYDAVKEVYIHPESAPLPVAEVESRIVAAIYEAYDNATNGNRDRGGMKRASEILRAFRPHFPQSTDLADIDHLIRATHSLSFYHLTLQHGVPFKPVAIRVQKDPLTLLEKVLEQDTKAYTKLDDLLEIGRNLVRAHLPNRDALANDLDPLELRISDADHRITYQAIMAALTADDFDTAYAYITTRLHTTPSQSLSTNSTDDVSWRAAYAAGRYRPTSSPKNLSSRIDSLAQRMELLSRALMLAPSGEALSGILATWRRYEEEMEGLKTQAVEEERSFDAKADAALPGAFGLEDRDADMAETRRAMARRNFPASRAGPSYEEEAPMGLFDVARGAATALRKTAAIPLGSGGLRDLKITEAGSGAEWDATSAASAEGGRVRKRDVVANMVTSGLASGMGWVLGAQPRDRVDQSPEYE